MQVTKGVALKELHVETRVTHSEVELVIIYAPRNLPTAAITLTRDDLYALICEIDARHEQYLKEIDSLLPVRKNTGGEYGNGIAVPETHPLANRRD